MYPNMSFDMPLIEYMVVFTQKIFAISSYILLSKITRSSNQQLIVHVTKDLLAGLKN